jgi:succinate dehydrogenase/fumarate reductase flavoprotein subunit
MFPRTEMLDLVVVDGHAKGIVVRDMVSGKDQLVSADAVMLATGGYGNVFYLSTMPRAATSPPSGAPTNAAPFSPTPASRKSIRRASQ